MRSLNTARFLGQPKVVVTILFLLVFSLLTAFSLVNRGIHQHAIIQFGLAGNMFSSEDLSFDAYIPAAVDHLYHQYSKRSYDNLLKPEMRYEFHKEKVVLGYRQKMRWVLDGVRPVVYRFMYETISPSGFRYTLYFDFGLFIFLASFFSYMAVAAMIGRHDYTSLVVTTTLATVAFNFILQVENVVQGFFAPFEATVIAAGIFFSLRKSLVPLLIVLALAVLNRETGMIIGLIYLICNWGEPKAFVPLLLAPIILILPNLDLFTQPDFYQLSHFMVSQETQGPSLFTMGSYRLGWVIASLLNIFVLIFPALLILALNYRKMDLPWIKSGLFLGLYFVVLLGGTIITNLWAYLILVPTLAIFCGYGLFLATSSTNDETQEAIQESGT